MIQSIHMFGYVHEDTGNPDGSMEGPDGAQKARDYMARSFRTRETGTWSEAP